MGKRFLSAFIIIFALSPLWGQDIRFETSSSIDWILGELNTKLSYNLADAGIKLPNGRSMGEEILKRAYPQFLKESLFLIRVDSDSTIKTLTLNNELTLEQLDLACMEAGKVPPSLSPDLTSMTGRYKVRLENLFLNLAKNKREIQKPLIPVPSADYTGIIILADEELPIHGRRTGAFAEPCLFPKIWDTDMNLIYEKNMFEGQAGLMVCYTTRENIFRPTPSGLAGKINSLVGPNPMRIIAREVFGINPTDPVIHRDDALKILSTENNRRLLREGRVVLVLNEAQLKINY